MSTPLQFYFYSSLHRPDGNPKAFSFVAELFTSVNTPSFLIWMDLSSRDHATLAKIIRAKKPAARGLKVEIAALREIHISLDALLNSVHPGGTQYGLTYVDHIQSIYDSRSIQPVPLALSDTVKNAILRNNRHTLDQSYFDITSRRSPSELLLQTRDAIETGFRIFSSGKPLREHQILDFDIEHFLPPESHRGMDADGRRHFEFNNKRLYLRKVDRTPLESALGVDLIYHFIDEGRLVFVQYKCQRAGNSGKYYCSSDKNHDAEIQRMSDIPGLKTCANLKFDLNEARLCQCPVFVKLCKREIARHHSIPVGVYFPLCIWRLQLKHASGLSVRSFPHLNALQFQDLVKSSLIGSTREQSNAIIRHLLNIDDNRRKIVFEETHRSN